MTFVAPYSNCDEDAERFRRMAVSFWRTSLKHTKAMHICLSKYSMCIHYKCDRMQSGAKRAEECTGIYQSRIVITEYTAINAFLHN